MRITGCDLHARQQTLAMLDTATGEVVHRTFPHEGESVREFHSTPSGPARVGIEATGSMKWYLHLMEVLEIDPQVGHPATHRLAVTERKARTILLKRGGLVAAKKSGDRKAVFSWLLL